MFYVTLGAAALIGGLVAGGIPGLLIAAGVIGVAGLVARARGSSGRCPARRTSPNAWPPPAPTGWSKPWR